MTLLDDLTAQTDAMVDELREVVLHESPTGDVDRLDTLAGVLAGRWREAGATVEGHRVDGVGTHLELRWAGPPGTPADAAPVLLVGHYDTVHDVGTLQRNPWRVDDERRAWGPGTQDMKAGLVIARRALAQLHSTGTPARRPVVALVTADEEVGSITSSALIRDRARTSAAALVFEASTSAGALKTERKGVGLWTVATHGRAAHAGQRFFDGRNAIVALARLLPRIAGLSDEARGTTVNIGTVRGGTRANVVAAHAQAVIDVRFTDPDEAERVGLALEDLQADDDVAVTVDGGVNRPAMLRSSATDDLYARARACAQRLGFDLTQASAGGASDGNFTADEGTPTLDGLGGIGDGLHTDHEWVHVDSLPQRAALLAELLSAPDD
ncbi:MAG TPA: M20 family metallopeptidase [Euzebyales bacterium]